MTQYSHSRVECFNGCPYKFKLRYVDRLKTIHAPGPENALICGNTVHLAAETNLENALNFYKSNYPLITDYHVDEMIKFELLYPKIKEVLSYLNVYKQEHLISTKRFKGIVDLITKNEDGTYDVFDFKYSNNIDHYLESPQLHIYKYYLEKRGFKINRLGFIFIPKINIKPNGRESIYQYRTRLKEAVRDAHIIVKEVIYNPNMVIDFLDNIIEINEAEDYKKNVTNLCYWCEFENLCIKGDDSMILPSNTRREKKIDTNPDLWIYAQSYVGKSTFIDQYDDLLFLNTDGNIDNTTAPVIRIADEINVTGRITNRKFAWEVFKEVITELEKKDNDFKRIALDLVEDLFEHCRLYVYDKHGWEHESDGGYGKGWDMIRTEFLSNMKRLKNLGYQIIYISKEVATEVTLKNGTKYTTYKPNVNDKVANVLSGIVDLTIRAYVDGDKRYIQLVKDDNSFGGGRFNFIEKKCELNMDAFKKALINAQGDIKVKSKEAIVSTTELTPTEEPIQSLDDKVKEFQEENNIAPVETTLTTTEEAPKSRRRRKAE